MTAEIPPVVETKTEERREGWHTPNDCFKLLDVQKAMDSIFARLKEGNDRMDSIFGYLDQNDVRMGCMEDNIKELRAMQAENRQALAENTAKTDATYELLLMGRGLFKGIAFVGKWTRRIVMCLGPPISVILGIWYMIKPPK